jgi:hypothetical protein
VSLRQPNAAFLRTYLRRGAILRLGARVLAFAAILLAQGNPPELTTTVVILIVAVADRYSRQVRDRSCWKP